MCRGMLRVYNTRVRSLEQEHEMTTCIHLYNATDFFCIYNERCKRLTTKEIARCRRRHEAKAANDFIVWRQALLRTVYREELICLFTVSKLEKIER